MLLKTPPNHGQLSIKVLLITSRCRMFKLLLKSIIFYQIKKIVRVYSCSELILSIIVIFLSFATMFFFFLHPQFIQLLFEDSFGGYDEFIRMYNTLYFYYVIWKLLFDNFWDNGLYPFLRLSFHKKIIFKISFLSSILSLSNLSFYLLTFFWMSIFVIEIEHSNPILWFFTNVFFAIALLFIVKIIKILIYYTCNKVKKGLYISAFFPIIFSIIFLKYLFENNICFFMIIIALIYFLYKLYIKILSDHFYISNK